MFHPRREMESACRGLENGFRDVVLITTVQALDVEIEPAFLHKCFEKLLNQLRLKIPDSRRLEIDFVYKVRTSGKIDHNARERLVQRNVRMRESRNPPPVAARFEKRLTQNPTHIFDRMVAVDFEI